jgi:MYXO-CTERM domain-containing protein
MLTAISHFYAVNMPPHTFAQRCKRFLPLLAAPAALLLNQGEAKAVLTYNIFESAGNVVVQASGNLNLANPQAPYYYCGGDGFVASSLGGVCTGADPSAITQTPLNYYYNVAGPSTFDGTAFAIADSASGLFTMVWGEKGIFSIDNSYVSGDAIASSATFSGTSLSAIGFTQSSGLIGTWTLIATGDTIYACLGSGSCAPTPGPLPLLGAGAAFGWRRRLRKRIATPLTTPAQA